MYRFIIVDDFPTPTISYPLITYLNQITIAKGLSILDHMSYMPFDSTIAILLVLSV
jgi:hypothetical protein